MIQVTVGPFAFPFRQENVAAGPVTVLARPEAVTVQTDGAGLPGKIRTAFFMGMTNEYLIETSAGELTVTEPIRARGLLPMGTDVRLQFDDTGLYLLPAP